MIERREKKKMPKKHYFTIISCCVRLVSLNDSYVPVLVPLPVVDHVPLDIWGCKRWRRRLTSYVPLPCGRPIIHDLKHSSIDCHMQSGLYRCLWGDEHAAHCRMAREIIMTIYCPGCCSRCVACMSNNGNLVFLDLLLIVLRWSTNFWFICLHCSRFLRSLLLFLIVGLYLVYLVYKNYFLLLLFIYLVYRWPYYCR